MMRLLNEVLDAVKAMRALCAPCYWGNAEAEELCGSVADVVNELLFEVAQALIDEYGRDGAMRTLAGLHSVDYDEFVAMTLNYRQPIVGDDEPKDWEYPFYAILMLTEPVVTTNEEEADEQ